MSRNGGLCASISAVLPVVMFRCLTVSHKFPRETLCPVVIWSISENFCDYHGTWLFPRYNHRNFQKWVITTELSGQDVSRGNLCDTVRHRKLYHRQYSTLYIQKWGFVCQYFGYDNGAHCLKLQALVLEANMNQSRC